MFTSTQGCLKSDEKSEKLILEKLESKSSSRVFVEDIEDDQGLQARINDLSEKIDDTDLNCEDCKTGDTCEEKKYFMLSKQPKVLIFVVVISIGLLGNLVLNYLILIFLSLGSVFYTHRQYMKSERKLRKSSMRPSELIAMNGTSGVAVIIENIEKDHGGCMSKNSFHL